MPDDHCRDADNDEPAGLYERFVEAGNGGVDFSGIINAIRGDA